MNMTMRLSTLLQVQGPDLAAQPWKLLTGQVVSIDHSKGHKLACTAGRLWVTLEHDGSDYILDASQSLEIDENGRIVISALGDGAFKVA